MSGTGKSSALVEVSKLNFQVVDTDEPGWIEWSAHTGGYKAPEQRGRVLRDLAEVEPLLRRTCTVEIDARQPLLKIVDQLAELGRDAGG